MKVIRFSIAGLVLVAAGVGMAAWGGSCWLELSRCEVRVDGAWVRLDNGFRHRQDLIRDLLVLTREHAAGRTEPARRLQTALQRLERFAAVPVLPDNRDRSAAYLAWQRRLADALADFTGSLGVSPGGEIAQVRDRIADLEDRIRSDLERFDLLADELAAASRRFPGSLVARLTGKGPAGCPAAAPAPVLAR